MRYSVPLTANQPRAITCPGSLVLQVVDTGVAPTVSLTIYDKLGRSHLIGAVRDGFKARLPAGFDSLELLSTVAATADVLVLPIDIEADFFAAPLNVVEEATPAYTDAAGPPGQVLFTANANRKKFRIRNEGTNDGVIYVVEAAGGGPLTIHPGEVWIEEDGAHLAWYARCTVAAGTTFFSVQELTA